MMGWVYNATPEVEAVSDYRVILGVCLSLTVLMVVTVSLRLLVRAQASRLGAADYVMAVSMVIPYHRLSGCMLTLSRYLALPIVLFVLLVS